MPRRKKNLKLPNGFGSITYLGEGRRKPWRVRKTSRWQLVDAKTGKALSDSEAIDCKSLTTKVIEKQRYVNIGTYETYEEAFLALSKYNQNPYDQNADKITLDDVADQWMKSVLPKYSARTQADYKDRIRRLPDQLLQMRIQNIRVMDIETALRSLNSTVSYIAVTCTLLKHLYNYALKHDYCTKNCADFLDPATLAVKAVTRKPHKPFSADEVEYILNYNGRLSHILKVALYTGMRPEELLLLKHEHIHLADGYIVHGSKTDAGKNRIIPIHENIRDIIESLSKTTSTGYLFEYEWGAGKRRYSYHTYLKQFKKIFPDHAPHDTRHTFITHWRKTLKLDDAILHLIVGHEDSDISERVYTHRSVEDLRAEMELFHYQKRNIAVFRAV